MNLPATLFSPAWHGLAVLICLGVFYLIARTAPWQRLAETTQRNLLFGLAISLALLWSMKAGVKPGLNLHLLGAMVATLALGEPLALIALALSLTAITLNGELGWTAWPVNYVLMVVVPVAFASLFRRLVERRLPNHFFIFIFVVAFLGSALSVIVQGVSASLVMVLAGAYPAGFLMTEYLPYFILLGFSEAWLSGAIITLLVVYKPEWVAAFDDRRYLIGK